MKIIYPTQSTYNAKPLVRHYKHCYKLFSPYGNNSKLHCLQIALFSKFIKYYMILLNVQCLHFNNRHINKKLVEAATGVRIKIINFILPPSAEALVEKGSDGHLLHEYISVCFNIIHILFLVPQPVSQLKITTTINNQCFRKK